MRTTNSENNIEANQSLDKVKWVLVVLLIAFVVWGNFYFSVPNSVYQPNVIVRIIAAVTVSVLALVLALTTKKGKSFISFAKESRLELRKVVWPSRKEAVQTTILIAVITVVVGVCLWGLDSLFFEVISYLTILGH